jgi:hypothetical protein
VAARHTAQCSHIEIQAVEKRRVSRRISGKSVTLKSSHGERAKAHIHDVSNYGCSLESDAPWLRNGAFVSVVVSTDRSIQAIVRWARDGKAGAEFLRPIPGSEAEELADD